jgi:phosphatidate phosphatase LPIN
LGHIIPLVGGDWSHDGIAEFFNAIQENGYQFIYLSARAIGQSQITRNMLNKVKQSDRKLPDGPLLISPDTLMTALHRFVLVILFSMDYFLYVGIFFREVIAKKPEDFKIECLKNIASLFPGKNPFYAGFGNRINVSFCLINYERLLLMCKFLSRIHSANYSNLILSYSSIQIEN